MKEDVHRRLYIGILDQDVVEVLYFMREHKIQLTDPITINGNTALHVVVATTKNTNFLRKLLEKGLVDVTQLDVKNSDGSTPLHVAAIVGNIEAAKMLVEKNKDLLLAKDNEGQIPLARALFNLHSDLYLYLLDQTKYFDRELDILPTGADELVVNAISSKDFQTAQKLFDIFRPVDSDAVLMAMAQNIPLLDIWETMTYKVSYYATIKRLDVYIDNKNVHKYRSRIYPIFAKVWPLKFLVMKCDQHVAAFHLLLTVCSVMSFVSTDSDYRSFINPIFEATRQNAVEVVQIILRYIPNAIWTENEDGHNIIQHAVVIRSENVYNLLYQMTEQKNIYKTIKDSSRNNLLHLAARLAPPSKLNLISGAALQIQRELQWFEEVKTFVCPLNIIQKNSFEETPKMVFTREHKDLVIEGEKWMKDTAESYTITAALITRIMFAAAITVPGGNQESGIPIFTNKIAFKIFAVSDAISLFSSITSLVMFMSILTARFAEQDFLYTLPIKMIIGLTTLAISTIAMIVAFGATMFLVFGKSDSSVLVHIAIWSFLPIACFLKFHFPLVAELISATYGPSIFGKKTDQPFY